MAEQINLNGQDWMFKGFYGEDWKLRNVFLPNTHDRRWWRPATVPGSVMEDLHRLGEIPDPYSGLNSLACEWVPQRDWAYRKQFTLDSDLAGKRIRLHFKGVDYNAHFYLNGTFLGFHAGMYTPVIFDVSHLLNYGGENTLVVVIEHAPFEQPQIGHTSRVRTHKGRMGYWWDFCPRMVHQGIWDEVFLETSGKLSIEDVFVRPVLATDHRSAAINVAISLDAASQHPAEMKVTLTRNGQVVTEQRALVEPQAEINSYQIALELEQPELWWPNGQGAQPLYTIVVCVHTAGEESDRREVVFGIRSIELAPNEGAAEDALSYTFIVNGRKVYIKGWNWVPMDALFGPERPEKLRRLLDLARQAHVNLLRVWGGGLIEKDSFYDLCDQYGIMVWQEFIQSSSGLDNNAPDEPEFINMLVREAEQIVPSKRNHPALALWCGGNELQAGDEQPLDDSHPTLAALKETVQRLDPDRLWLATSPTGRVFSNSLRNIAQDPQALHDVHGPWEYQGMSGQYELYNQGSSLLHSEFGVEGITNLKTLNAVIPPGKQWPVSLDDNPYWFHLGAWWVRRTTWDAAFGELPDVEHYVHATQFIQFDGLRYALEADRRRKFHNSGTLPWQFNEPFPMAACTSAIDYYAHPKPAYYAVATAYRPLHVSARYTTLVWQDQAEFEVELWAHNTNPDQPLEAVLKARLVGLSGKVYAEITRNARCAPNAATHLSALHAPLEAVETVFFLDLRLEKEAGQILAENRYLFSRASNLRPLFEAPAATLEIRQIEHADGWQLTITNQGPGSALGVWLEDGRMLGTAGFENFDINYLFLFPGESRDVQVSFDQISPQERLVKIKGWNTQEYQLRSE